MLKIPEPQRPSPQGKLPSAAFGKRISNTVMYECSYGGQNAFHSIMTSTHLEKVGSLESCRGVSSSVLLTMDIRTALTTTNCL